ncbi:MAG TPA: sigma-70 family RNA polymerase sigma factor [Armatimonadota bacterium]|nr:sigma-70 family RNA polymerase sigma factor [Armatimonadota bacterium]
MITDRERIYNELLVLRCRRREDGAMEELVHRWEKRLFYYIRRLVSDEEDACDVLQETWLKAIRGIATLRDPGILPMWLYRIARNTAMSRLRGRYADKAVIEDEPGEIPDNGDSFTFEDAEQVHYGLSRISLPHREVLTLYFLEDLSVDEIAEVLGVASGTVKSRLHFAKKALRAVLEQEAVR